MLQEPDSDDEENEGSEEEVGDEELEMLAPEVEDDKEDVILEASALSDLTSLEGSPDLNSRSTSADVALMVSATTKMEIKSEPVDPVILSLPLSPSSSLTTLSSKSVSPIVEGTLSTASLTPFRSIISTRRQKQVAAAAEGAASTSSSVSQTPQRRSARFSSLSSAGTPLAQTTKRLDNANEGKGKGKAKEVDVPEQEEEEEKVVVVKETRQQRRDREREGKERKGKDNEVECETPQEFAPSRTLRVRENLIAAQASSAHVNLSPLVGPDGRALPTCGTCGQVLPVIAIDLQIIWGADMDTVPDVKGKKGKRKRDVKHDCPR